MPMDIAAVDHACNVVRRRIAEEVPELNLLFLSHEHGRPTPALIPKQMEITQRPGGKAFWTHLQNIAQNTANPAGIQGVLMSQDAHKFLKFIKKEKYLAVFFVDTSHFEKTEEVTQHAYHLAWHALNIINDVQLSPAAFKKLAENEEGNFYRAPEDKAQIAYNNMLADAFSALVMETLQEKGSIRRLARQRCLMSLQAKAGFDARQYPYPIALDATVMVHEQLGHKIVKSNIFPAAFQLSKEIGHTFDLNSVRQWGLYAQPAQEMAWCDIHKHKILGAATFSSEDPYIRSIAYIVADVLGIDPPLPDGHDFFNAFTDQEANERHHKKRRDDIFQSLSRRVTSDLSAALFIEEADKQNQRLLKGEFFGWCADGLLMAAEIIQQSEDNIKDGICQAENVFQSSYKRMPWDSLLNLGRQITGLHMRGAEVKLKDLQELCKENTEFSGWSGVFQPHGKK